MLVVAVLVAIPLLISHGSTGARGRDPAPPRPATTTSVEVAFPHTETGPGDLAPHEVENRSGLLPKDLTPEAQQRLNREANRIRPVLESLRAKGDFSAESLKQALVRLGYRADQVATQRRENLAVFGISAKGGCLLGDIRPERALVLAQGPSAEWGCLPPGPTH